MRTTLPTRDEIGDNRAAAYEVLQSFDARGLDQATLTRKTLSLVEIDGDQSAQALREALLSRWSNWPAGEFALATDSSSADEITSHRFTFYGEAHQLPEAINWEHNPGTAHWGMDLNRFGYLRTLAAAHRDTGDMRYARKAVELILAWVDATDVADGFVKGRSPYAWSSYLNIAIHLDAWSQTLAYILPRIPQAITDDELVRIIKSMHDQLMYLWIVIPEQKNNWVTIGCRGVLVTLARLGILRITPWLTKISWQRLDEAVQRQVLPDGVQDELTPCYHMVVLRNIFVPLQLADYLPEPPPTSLRLQLKKMLSYARQTLTPDGLQVNFNDSDALAGERTQQLLDTPAARELVGSEFDEPCVSRTYPYAGIAFLRQGSDKGSDELYLAFDAGPFGMSHQHEDKLGFWLSAYGRPLVVDAGRHLYDPSPEAMRAFLGSTAAHSTIMIDGQGQRSRDFRDTWRSVDPIDLQWRNEAGRVSATGSYTLGYGPEHIPVTHSRTITLVADPGCYIIEDRLAGAGEHLVESRLQFPPADVSVEGLCVRTNYQRGNLLVLVPDGQWDNLRIEQGRRNPDGGWFSPSVNQLAPAPAAVWSLRAATWPVVRRFILLPYPGQSPDSTLVSRAKAHLSQPLDMD